MLEMIGVPVAEREIEWEQFRADGVPFAGDKV